MLGPCWITLMVETPQLSEFGELGVYGTEAAWSHGMLCSGDVTWLEREGNEIEETSCNWSSLCPISRGPGTGFRRGEYEAVHTGRLSMSQVGKWGCPGGMLSICKSYKQQINRTHSENLPFCALRKNVTENACFKPKISKLLKSQKKFQFT